MEKLKQIKTQILELHKQWDAIPDDDDSLDGFKDAEIIESEVQDLILDFCEKRKYTINGLTIEKLKTLYEEDEDKLFPYESWLEVIEQLALTHDDVVELLWFFYHTFWPDDELWGDVERMRRFISNFENS
jgi:hypothetical protein